MEAQIGPEMVHSILALRSEIPPCRSARFKKIVLQRRSADLGGQRLDVDFRCRRFGVDGAAFSRTIAIATRVAAEMGLFYMVEPVVRKAWQAKYPGTHVDEERTTRSDDGLLVTGKSTPPPAVLPI